MSTVTTTLFLSNRSQALRLPRDVAFPEGVKAVRVIRDGPRRLVTPADAAWDDFFDDGGIDMPDRVQLASEAREPW